MLLQMKPLGVISFGHAGATKWRFYTVTDEALKQLTSSTLHKNLLLKDSNQGQTLAVLSNMEIAVLLG